MEKVTLTKKRKTKDRTKEMVTLYNSAETGKANVCTCDKCSCNDCSC